MTSLICYFLAITFFISCASVQTEKTANSNLIYSSYDSMDCKLKVQNMNCTQAEEILIENKKFAVERFFIDQVTIQLDEYAKCVGEKGCKKISASQNFFVLNFENAYDYCKWQGKRLPNYEELLLAKEKNLITLENSEWTNTWAEDCAQNCPKISCGKSCISTSNPCSGRYPCGKSDKKFILLNSGEKKQVSILKKDELHHARCVSSSPYLTKAPAWMIKDPPKKPESLPSKPIEEQLELLHQLKGYDVLDKKFCSKPYLSPADCRDPVSYIKSNESRNYLFAPYIKNLRGGYIGVAADANYSYISYAKSEWVFLMDFDPVILNLHRTIRAFVKESPTVKDFLDQWHSSNKQSVNILEKYYVYNSDFSTLKSLFLKNRAVLYEHYKSISLPSKENGDFGWLRNPENYEYIRHLYLNDRISIHGGDLLKDKTLYNIGEAAKQLGIKIRVFYPSNAEEFWEFSENYKRNILNLPFDEASVVLRTVHEFPWHVNDRTGGSTGFWHYVVHGALNYQKYLRYPDYYHIQHFKNERIIPTNMRDFSTIHLPHSIPENLRKLF